MATNGAAETDDNTDHRPTSRMILPLYDSATTTVVPSEQESNENTSNNGQFDTYFSDEKVHIPERVS